MKLSTRCLAVAGAAVCAAHGNVAVAQEPTSTHAQAMALSAYVPPAPASVLSAGGVSDTIALSPSLASLPLRLTMQSSLFPVGPALGNGGCSASVETAGSIFPVQPYTYVALTPRLVLHGFSDLGCPGDPRALLDSGMGGAITYTAPVAKDLSLVSSGGAYGVPGNGLPPRYAAHFGLDLVKRFQDGRILYSGVGVTQTSRGLRVLSRIGATF